MYGMLESLAPPLRDMLSKVDALHDGAKVYTDYYGIEPKAGKTFNRTVHPVILKHPVTGRELLWVNNGFTRKLVGFPYHQGRQILQMLFDHTSNSTEWQCRVNWKRPWNGRHVGQPGHASPCELGLLPAPDGTASACRRLGRTYGWPRRDGGRGLSARCFSSARVVSPPAPGATRPGLETRERSKHATMAKRDGRWVITRWYVETDAPVATSAMPTNVPAGSVTFVPDTRPE